MFTKKALLCYSILLFNCFTLFAQNRFEISGKVIDTDNQPLAYAMIVLKLATEQQAIASTTADENGEFRLTAVSEGAYTLVIENIGFETQEIIIDVDENKELGNIYLIAAQNVLESVTVQGRKPTITRKIDRVVLNVDNLAAAAGRSAFDVFRMAPGVSIIRDNIAINGVQGARVMVNNRLLQLAGQELTDYLKSLKPEDIQSIEVIAKPSAEFEAEGSGGLINIILKKRRESGLNAHVGHDFSQGLGRFAGFRPFANVSYNTGKLALSADYSYFNGKMFENLDQQRTLADGSDYTNKTTSDETRKINRLRLYGTYDFNENHLISLDYTARSFKADMPMVSSTEIIAIDETRNLFSNGDFPIYRNTQYQNIGLNYTWKTDTLGSQLQLIADYTVNKADASSTTNSTTFNYLGNPISDTAFVFRFPSNLQLFTAEVKYNKKISTNWSILFGGKIATATIDNNNVYDIFNNGTWMYGQDAFDFLYRERVTAGFANLSGTIWGTEILLGLRGEHSNIKGDLSSELQDSLVRQDYFNLFPSLHLQKKLDAEGIHILTLSANRRIRRPTYTEMNPYQYFIDNFTVVTGNPNLQPQLTTGAEIGYLLKQKYHLGFAYSQTKGIINQVFILTPDAPDIIVNRANTGTAERFSITGNAPVKFASWWDSSSNLELSYSTSVAPQFDLSIYSLMLQTNHDYKLGKGYTANLTAIYTPRILSGNLITTTIASVDVGFRKKFFEDKFTVAASVSDIFYTANFGGTSYFNDETIVIQNRQQTRAFNLSLTYNFNLGKAFSIRKLEKSNHEESGRL